ncbi:MAG: DUF370 domain-containing protein, partial [Deltaproteobacteria bacterium]|nr:DUF370 domain-containing protein [Deltaproteobacteria bacterium]
KDEAREHQRLVDATHGRRTRSIIVTDSYHIILSAVPKEKIMNAKLTDIGFGNSIDSDRIVAIVPSNSAPMKRLKDEAREHQRLVDATHGRRTRSIIVTDSYHIILSAVPKEVLPVTDNPRNSSQACLD